MVLSCNAGTRRCIFLAPYAGVRTAGNPYSLVPDIRAAIHEVDPNQPIANIRTMNEILDHEVSDRKLQTIILAAFATSALLLALVGLYGVLSYTVAQRTREIGVRMALGAQGSSILRLVLRQSILLTAIGIALGVAGASMVTRSLQGMLFDITPVDPTIFISVSLMFALVAT